MRGALVLVVAAALLATAAYAGNSVVEIQVGPDRYQEFTRLDGGTRKLVPVTGVYFKRGTDRVYISTLTASSDGTLTYTPEGLGGYSLGGAKPASISRIGAYDKKAGPKGRAKAIVMGQVHDTDFPGVFRESETTLAGDGTCRVVLWPDELIIVDGMRYKVGSKRKDIKTGEFTYSLSPAAVDSPGWGRTGW